MQHWRRNSHGRYLLCVGKISMPAQIQCRPVGLTTYHLPIDERSETPRPAKRKPALAATITSAGSSATQLKRARSRAKGDWRGPAREHGGRLWQLHLAHVANAHPMQTFIRIRLYRQMFTDFARQVLISSPISTLYDLCGSCPAVLLVLALHRPPGNYLRPLRIDSLTFIFLFNECLYQHA